jgi:hypothetical protein
MAMVAGWSSIPSDLLNRVADGLLATGDVDCYVSLRAVCHHWRHATAAPSGTDRRFLPLRWVMLGFDAGNFHGFFLNVDTGRLLWKDLPALRDYAYITKDNDGLLILQGTKNSTDNFSALNPFTGVSISFPLRYPACGRAFAAGSSPEVTLATDLPGSTTLYAGRSQLSVREPIHLLGQTSQPRVVRLRRILPRPRIRHGQEWDNRLARWPTGDHHRHPPRRLAGG